MDQVDPMDSMDVLCYQKNKSVHLVYKNRFMPETRRKAFRISKTGLRLQRS